MAGALAIILTLLLFVVGPPPEVALKPAGTNVPEDEQSESEPPLPEPATEPLIELTVSQGAFPISWDERELLMVQSHPAPAPVQFALRSAGWTPAIASPTPVARDFPDRYVDHAIVLASQALTLIDSSDLPPASPSMTSGTHLGVEVEKVWLSDRDDSLEYALIIRNQSPSAIEHVAVRDSLPGINQVVDVTPPAAVSPRGELVWELGTMDAGAELRLLVKLLPAEAGVFETLSVANVQTRFGAVTQVSEPLVPETIVTTPEPALTEPETILPEPVLPAGFADNPQPALPTASPDVETPAQVVEEPVVPVFPFAINETPTVLPDETPDVVTPAATVEEPATELFPFDRTERPIPRPLPLGEAEPPQRPLLRLHSASPDLVHRGEIVTTVYQITNEGTAAAENVVLTVHLTDELLHRHGANVRHKIQRLEPGESTRARLLTRARETGTATLDAALTHAGENTDSEMSYIRVTTAGNPQPGNEWGASDADAQEPAATETDILR